MLLKTLILMKMNNGEDMRDHIRNFFDVVDKIQKMELVIIDDLLTILLLYSIPDEYKYFEIFSNRHRNSRKIIGARSTENQTLRRIRGVKAKYEEKRPKCNVHQ